MTAITAHMAAEGIDADLPTLHSTRLLADGAWAIAATAVVAEVVLKALTDAEDEA